MRLSLCGSDWTVSGWVRHQWEYEKPMETKEFSMPAFPPMPARVPGSVHTDLRRAGILEDWNEGRNFLHAEWVEHREWVYTKVFRLPDGPRRKRYVLHFGGLDFSGYVFLNGERILAFDQMHIPCEADVSERLLEGDNHLKVVFLQPPEVDGQVGYTSRTTILKSRYNYGWDWMPRLVNIGIFGNVTLHGFDTVRVTDFYPKAQAAARERKIGLSLSLDSDAQTPVHITYTVRRENRICARKEERAVLRRGENHVCHEMDLPDALLWYPNGAGAQPLYTVEAVVRGGGQVLDSVAKTVGFRSFAYMRPEGAREDALPYALRINGIPVPIKGVNWVPLSPFYGSVTEEEYRYYLGLMREMNVNLLRVWGGSLLESETFYRLCDEMGLLVWQEFPQSSSGIDNTPCAEPAFIKRLAATAESYIVRRRHHACLAFWCGGNELYQPDFEPTDTRSPNLAALEQTVRRLDPDRLFLPASPSGASAGFQRECAGTGAHGDTHGPWKYLGEKDHYARFDADDSLLQSEVGAPAPPRVETLFRYCKGSLWPPTKDNPFWLSRGSWWLYDQEMDRLFGGFDGGTRGIRAYVRGFRYIQMEALRYAAASVRRAGRRKAGIILWMANEPFPNSANTSLIEFDGCPKPAYYKMRSVFAPVMLGLAYESPALREGERLCATLFAAGDGFVRLRDIRVKAFDLWGRMLADQDLGSAALDGAADLAALELPAAKPLVLVRISAADESGRPIQEEYLFTVGGASPFGVLLDTPRTPLVVERIAENRFRVTNPAETAALCLDCTALGGGRPLAVENNARCLLPGECVELRTAAPCESLTVDLLNSGGEGAAEPAAEAAAIS